MDRRLNGARGASPAKLAAVIGAGLLALFALCTLIMFVALRPKSSVPAPIDTDVLTLGTGAGGLTLSYIASTRYGKRLTMVDDRDRVGGVVYSFRNTASPDSKPVWGQTHAEQFLGRHAIMRLLTERMGTPVDARTVTGVYTENFVRGHNTTARYCYGPSGDRPPGAINTPDGVPLCGAGYPAEGVAPNGWIGNQTDVYPGLPELCPADSWKDCSYGDQLFGMLLEPANLATITDDESIFGYMTRILGETGKDFLVETQGMEYLQASSARFHFTEKLPYEWQYFRVSVWVPHGGPMIGLWNRVARVIQSRKVRVNLNSAITSVDYNTDPRTKHLYRYVATVGATGQIYRAKKLVLAISSHSMRSLKGTIGAELANSRFVRQVHAGAGCTFNGYWPDQFWKPSRLECHIGLCANQPHNYSYPPNTSQYAAYQIIDTPVTGSNSIGFAQFIGSIPERQETGLVRFFFETEESCAPFNRLLASGGQEAVTQEMMRRIRHRLGPSYSQQIPYPTQSFFRFENAYEPVIAAGANFTAVELAAWAREPIPGEKICAVSTTFQPLYGGWMEGAARSALACLEGPVFEGDFTQEELDSYKSGPATTTWDSQPRNISEETMNQLRPDCVLLSNEYSPRDRFDFPTLMLQNGLKCGGSTTYPWPTLEQIEALPTPLPPQTAQAQHAGAGTANSAEGEQVPQNAHRRYTGGLRLMEL